MNDRDWNYEEITEEEARLRGPDCEMIQVFSVVDQHGERRLVIFVWRTENETNQDPTRCTG